MAKKHRQKRVWRLLRSVVFVYSAIALYLFFFADRMIFLPPAVTYEHQPETDPTAVAFTTEQGENIAARYLRNPDSQYTILFSHGNAMDLGGTMPILLQLQAAGFSVLSYDYPGYGHSSGRPTERSAYRAIEAAYQYLIEEQGLDPDEIIVQGMSVGSGPSTYLASREPVAGLILESAFSKAFEVVVPFRVMTFEKFPNVWRIGEIDCPLLLLHGTEDELVPFEHSEKLLAAADEPKRLVPIEGAGHNDILWEGEALYLASIQAFAEQIERSIAAGE